MQNGYIDVASGKLPNIETRLEMLAPPQRPAEAADVAFTLERMPAPIDAERYLALFRRIGEPWLWCSRLAMPQEQLESILNDPDDEVYVLRNNGEDAGLLELDFREPGECEITFFGVIEEVIGRGAGRWLMNRAIELAWRRPIRRFWLHTCTLDHPRALDFYIRSGFIPYERKIEILDDPRITGLLPRDAAPQVPIL